MNKIDKSHVKTNQNNPKAVQSQQFYPKRASDPMTPATKTNRSSLNNIKSTILDVQGSQALELAHGNSASDVKMKTPMSNKSVVQTYNDRVKATEGTDRG